MDFLWILTLAVLAAGYFALAGYDYGAGVLLRLIGREEPERRQVLGALGPFLLGNEVWLVALAGTLLGVFPAFEARLFSGAYPVVLAIVLGVVAFTVAVQLRGRLATGRKPFWDLLITAGAAVTAIGWGVLLGAMLEGLPLGTDGYPTGDFSGLLTSGTVLSGVLMFSLFTLHGAVLLAARSTGRIARRAKRVARTMIAPGVAAVLAVVADGVFGLDLAHPGLALSGAGLLVLAVFAVGWMLDKRPVAALACSATACVLPVFIVVTAHLPNALVSSLPGGAGLPFDAVTSSSSTLAQVGWLALPIVPAVIGLQAVTWWAFRRRVDDRTGLFW